MIEGWLNPTTFAVLDDKVLEVFTDSTSGPAVSNATHIPSPRQYVPLIQSIEIASKSILMFGAFTVLRVTLINGRQADLAEVAPECTEFAQSLVDAVRAVIAARGAGAGA